MCARGKEGRRVSEESEREREEAKRTHEIICASLSYNYSPNAIRTP